jgi:hypothetical protein
MKTKAVIDRFEGDKAVLFIGEEQVVVSRSLLPRKAKEGHWLLVELEDGKLMTAAIDEEETARVKERVAEKLAALRRGDHLKG